MESYFPLGRECCSYAAIRSSSSCGLARLCPSTKGPASAGQGRGRRRRGVLHRSYPHTGLRLLPMRTIIRRRQLVVEMGSQLRRAGLRHVVCWRSEVQDTTAHDFAVNFYKSLSQEPTQAPNFERAFSRAVARMGGAAGASASRAPQRHLGSGAVDFVCLLSENGDKYPSSGHSRS